MGAAVFAFIGWLTACTLAVIRSHSLSMTSSKVVCWIIPAIGITLLVLFVHEGLFGPASGFRSIALGLTSLALWVLAVILPVVQLLACFLAKKIGQVAP